MLQAFQKTKAYKHTNKVSNSFYNVNNKLQLADI